jgi:hypothetical protein
VFLKTPTHLSKKAMALLKDFEAEMASTSEGKGERKGLFHQLSDFFQTPLAARFTNGIL